MRTLETTSTAPPRPLWVSWICTVIKGSCATPPAQPSAIHADLKGAASFPPLPSSGGRLPCLHHTREVLRYRWNAALLSVLRRRYFGAATARLLEASALPSYLCGAVQLFTRHRVGPPLDAVNRTRDSSSGERVKRHDSKSGPSPPAADPDGRNGFRGILHNSALQCVYIGRSPIHSRGLFTAADLPKGTRIIAEPHRSLLLAPDFIRLLADTHEKLPDTWYYTQPSGPVIELTTQAQPHHLFNHSCQANVVAGLSHAFWGAAFASGSDAVIDRLQNWPQFGDANSFFLARDVEAGEELTVDYSTRMAPIYSAEQLLPTQALIRCRCGAVACRHYVYQQNSAIKTYLHYLKHSNRSGKTGAKKSSFQVASDLLRLGFDDELVILAHLPSSADIMGYLHRQNLSLALEHPSGPRGTTPAEVPPSPPNKSLCIDSRLVQKRDILQQYRHVFRALNEATPSTR